VVNNSYLAYLEVNTASSHTVYRGDSRQKFRERTRAQVGCPLARSAGGAHRFSDACCDVHGVCDVWRVWEVVEVGVESARFSGRK